MENRPPSYSLVIYVAGVYRAETEWQVIENIRDAEHIAQEVWKRKMVAICPHLNTSHWGGILPDDVWLKGYLTLLQRCDALITVYNWKTSTGAQAEVAFAKAHSIPVFHFIQDLEAWKDDYRTY